MIGCAGQWTRTPAATALQPKNEMLIFRLRSLLIIDWVSWWTWTPSVTPLLPIKWNADFSITFNFWWSAWLVNGLKAYLPPLSSQKNEMLLLDLCSLLMISQAGWWTRTPSATSLQPKKWNANFWITFTLNDQPGWSMDSNPIHHPSPAKKMKCSFLDYVQLRMISWAGQWTWTPSASPLQLIKWNATFWITFNFWWSAGLVNGLKPHPPPLSSQKNEMLIFGLCSLLMICLADWWTWTPSTTPLLPIKWNAHFSNTFSF